jgi:hypothetical protein
VPHHSYPSEINIELPLEIANAWRAAQNYDRRLSILAPTLSGVKWQIIQRAILP